ncbi:acyl-CoA thioesterase [Parvularcula sp. LCG005]|uniref:acyl-CoA thioesterase n=1 Tax=Parvularcula sp. LCG005 TaxID=3078805 RepID=UPI002943F455|nr:acyl-CoA thioesterase [Parvularcula sp. LCG005]WOI53283.1 acyl-CoA thioesterase [Parvularcula sp. LCG005]
MSQPTEPKGTLQTRTLTMPADANGSGDIFGGWVMSQMDIAGAIGAVEKAQNRVVTVAVDSMHFVSAVHVSDIVCCYTDVVRVGRTSITVHVETWVLRQMLGDRVKVTEADFTYVAVDADGRPTPIEQTA